LKLAYRQHGFIGMKSVRFGIALLAAGTALTAAPHVAAAQQVGAYREDAGTALNRHLRTLADTAAQPFRA
jgi:hypothetical protein